MKRLMGESLALALCLLPGGCARGGGQVPAAVVLSVVEDLVGQAGTAYQAKRLLAAADAAGPTRAEAAAAAGLRCALDVAERGPRPALGGCRAAAALPEAGYRNRLRLATALVDAGEAEEGLRLAYEVALPKDDPIGEALVWWARSRGRVARGMDGRPEAVDAQMAVEKAVRLDQKYAEFLAIADYRCGLAHAAAAALPATSLTWASEEREKAERHLRLALRRQRQLDAENPEYAEYRLYLVRVLRALGDLGDEACAAEARSLAAELLRRDPARAEYQAEVRR